MKSSHWKTIAVACAASLLALGCSKNAESKGLPPASADRAPAEAPGAAEAPAAATPAEVETAAAAPAEVEGVAPEAVIDAEAAEKAIEAAPVATKGAVRAFRGTNQAPKAMSGGATIKKDTYTVTIVPSSVSSGAEGTIKVTLVPTNGRKINMEFPTKLTVVAPAGVSVSKPKQQKGDAVTFNEKKAVFDVKFKAAAAGDKSFTGKFKFAVCTDATCDPKTEALAFKVPVK